MAVRAVFYGGPLNDQWRAMQEPVSAFRIAVDKLTGVYVAGHTSNIAEGEWVVEYDWRGWDVQEVQESKGTGVE